MGVSGCGGDFGVAHYGFAGVFAGSCLGEVGAEEVSGCSDGGVGGESCVFEGLFPSAAFGVAGEWLSVLGEYEVVGLALVFVGEVP